MVFLAIVIVVVAVAMPAMDVATVAGAL